MFFNFPVHHYTITLRNEENHIVPVAQSAKEPKPLSNVLGHEFCLSFSSLHIIKSR